MDADLAITIAFCLEVLLALAAGLFYAHKVRKSPSHARAEIRAEPNSVVSAKPIAAGGTRAVSARAGRAVRGLRR